MIDWGWKEKGGKKQKGVEKRRNMGLSTNGHFGYQQIYLGSVHGEKTHVDAVGWCPPDVRENALKKGILHFRGEAIEFVKMIQVSMFEEVLMNLCKPNGCVFSDTYQESNGCCARILSRSSYGHCLFIN